MVSGQIEEACKSNMKPMSRNRLMTINAMLVLVTTVLNIFLGMWEIRLLIERYGTAVNGLTQTANQLLTYLTLLEAGIGSSYIHSLYKPLSGKDYSKVSSLYVGYKASLRNAVFKMIALASLASLLYPLFLKNNGMSYWFMVAVLLIQSGKTILPYLLTLVPQNMIVLKELRYLVTMIHGFSKALIYACEILIIKCTNTSFLIMNLICLSLTITLGTSYELVMRRVYKNELDYHAEPDKSPNKMSSDVVAGNISYIVFSGTDNIILSMFDSLNTVTLYSNYNTISNHMTGIISNVIHGATASMGLKIAKKDENAYYVFRELLTGILFLGGIIASVFIVMMNEFVSLWVGSEFCLPMLNVVLFAYIMYANIVRPLIDNLNAAAGLFKFNRSYKILQAILNLVITISLVPFIGITGALIGTMFCRLFITIPKGYQLIHRKIFKEHKPRYIELPVAVAVSGCAALCGSYVVSLPLVQGMQGIAGFIVRALIASLIAVIINGLSWISMSSDFRRLLYRGASIATNRKDERKQTENYKCNMENEYKKNEE